MEEDQVEKLLINEYHTDKVTAERIARQSGNDMNKAFVLRQNTVFSFRDELTAWMRMLIGKKGNELAGWSSNMGGQEKEEQKQFALYTLSTIREILRATQDQKIAPDDMVLYLQRQFHPEVCVMTILQSTYEKIMRNANTKLLWLAASLQIKNQLAKYRYQYINT
jgi:hypothetical protein